MDKIKLPSGQSSQKQPDEEPGKEVSLEEQNVALQTQVSSMVEEMAKLNKTRRDDDDAEKKQAEEEEKARLEAEADIKTILAAGAEEEEGKPNKSKVDDLTPSELLDVISTAVDTAIDARIKQSSTSADGKLTEVVDSVKKLYEHIGRKEAKEGIDRARAKHTDFDKFKEDTMAVLKTYPMMDVEHAYLLAKQMRTGDSPSRNETDTERPVNTPFGTMTRTRESEPSRKPTKKKDAPSTTGVIGFRDFVGPALDKVLGSQEGR